MAANLTFFGGGGGGGGVGEGLEEVGQQTFLSSTLVKLVSISVGLSNPVPHEFVIIISHILQMYHSCIKSNYKSNNLLLFRHPLREGGNNYLSMNVRNIFFISVLVVSVLSVALCQIYFRSPHLPCL